MIQAGMPAPRHPLARLAALPVRLLGGEAGAGILLILVALTALALANSPLSGAYHAALHAPLPWTPIAKLGTLHLWINDAAMALFFFVVGLEIKREVLDGELSTPQRRRKAAIDPVAFDAVRQLHRVNPD